MKKIMKAFDALFICIDHELLQKSTPEIETKVLHSAKAKLEKMEMDPTSSDSVLSRLELDLLRMKIDKWQEQEPDLDIDFYSLNHFRNLFSELESGLPSAAIGRKSLTIAYPEVVRQVKYLQGLLQKVDDLQQQINDIQGFLDNRNFDRPLTLSYPKADNNTDWVQMQNSPLFSKIAKIQQAALLQEQQALVQSLVQDELQASANVIDEMVKQECK